MINAQSDYSLSILESRIISNGGQVLRITDPEYKSAATLHNRAIQIWPNLILRPATYDDVSLSLSTLSSLEIPIRIMGGRHSYGGYCSHQGIVIDSTLLKRVNIDWNSETVRMQAGVIWNDIYKVLNGSEYVILGGLCPTVGVVGFTLGGGYNAMYSRSYGFASDNLINLTVAL
jgi:FAD/FMN-containing dehydrogenase